jgi:DNA-binding transcriptional LysR family regulator
MEVHRREAFAAVATELRFGGAGGKPHNGRPALGGLIYPRERHGARVLFRVTRQVELTNADPELLARAKISLDDFAAAAAAPARAVARREDATVQVGIIRQEMSTRPSFIPVPGRAAAIGAATIEAS